MLHRAVLTLLTGAACLAGVPGAVAAEAMARSAARDSITTEQVHAHVAALADDTFEGREAGTRGNRAAAGYIVERLRQLGLRGGGPDGRFYQTGHGSNNVLAIIEGRDPNLKDEAIVIGAHFDHVGYGSYRNSYGPVGRIHNGADDNASGVAAVLEVAGAIARLRDTPRRTLLFAFWDGEEKGLLGSKYWIEHPTVPLSRVRLAVNVDMIGRLRQSRLEVLGSRSASGLRRLVSRQNDPQLAIVFDQRIRPDSDHYSFYAENVPFLMLHTGKHDDYHRPSDDAEKINREGLRQIAHLLFGIAVETADAAALGGFRPQSRYEAESDSAETASRVPAQPSRLGIRWEEAAARDHKIVVAAVDPGSPAAQAGLQPGDRLLTFNGHDVAGADDFRLRVLSAPKNARATVERSGSERPIDVALELAGEPVRLGLSWRTDEAEPGTLIVHHLTPGAPAQLAGLRTGDRIYAINGRDFASSAEFRALALTLPAPLVLEVENGGRVKTVEIPHAAEPPAANVESGGGTARGPVTPDGAPQGDH